MRRRAQSSAEKKKKSRLKYYRQFASALVQAISQDLFFGPRRNSRWQLSEDARLVFPDNSSRICRKRPLHRWQAGAFASMSAFTFSRGIFYRGAGQKMKCGGELAEIVFQALPIERARRTRLLCKGRRLTDSLPEINVQSVPAPPLGHHRHASRAKSLGWLDLANSIFLAETVFR